VKFETKFCIFSWLVKNLGTNVRTHWILAFFDLWDEPNNICLCVAAFSPLESQLAQLSRVTSGRNVSPGCPPWLLVLDHCDWPAVHLICLFPQFAISVNDKLREN